MPNLCKAPEESASLWLPLELSSHSMTQRIRFGTCRTWHYLKSDYRCAFDCSSLRHLKLRQIPNRYQHVSQNPPTEGFGPEKVLLNHTAICAKFSTRKVEFSCKLPISVSTPQRERRFRFLGSHNYARNRLIAGVSTVYPVRLFSHFILLITSFAIWGGDDANATADAGSAVCSARRLCCQSVID